LNSVSHDILLKKLHIYGIRGIVYDWFNSYLCDRYQFTCLGKVHSNKYCYRFGVPQGSVLGPLLFLIYVDNIGNSIPDAKVKLLADDTNLFVSHENVKNLNDNVKYNVRLLCQWFVANKLSLNASKTYYMAFSTRNQSPFRVTVDKLELKRVSACKYLGITLDEELKRKDHIDIVYGKLIKFVGIFL
jgi:hypothetical protein